MNKNAEWEGYRGFYLYIPLSLPDEYFINTVKKYLNRYEDWIISRVRHPEYLRLIKEGSSIVTCKSVKDFYKNQGKIKNLNFVVTENKEDNYKEYKIEVFSPDVNLEECYLSGAVGRVVVNLNCNTNIGYVQV